MFDQIMYILLSLALGGWTLFVVGLVALIALGDLIEGITAAFRRIRARNASQ